MKLSHLIPLLLIASSLTACAAGGKKIPIQDDVKHSIKTVAINPISDIPKIRVNSATQNIAANFGLIGMMVGDSDKRGKTDGIETAMAKRGVDVGAIIHDKFVNEMAKRTSYKPLEQGATSDATMFIDVHLVALDVAGAGTHYYPQLTVSAEMKDIAGKTIWRSNGTVGPLQKKNEAKYTYDELIAQPERLQEIMTAAAGLVAETVMADL